MVSKLSKTVYFLQICAELSKKFKFIKAFYIYVSEKSRYAVSENGSLYYAISYCFRDIRV